MKILKKTAMSTLLIALFSVGAAQAQLKIATDSGAQGSPSGDAIEKWAELIEEGTNGSLKTRVFYQNQLGGQEEVFDQHLAGDVELMLNWPMTSYDKRMGLIYTPYMFQSWDEALAAYSQNGWIYNLLSKIYEENSLKFLGAWPEGFSGVATKEKYALDVHEARNIKLRIPPAFPIGDVTAALGYQTATIDWGELFTSIQTGIVDGDSSNILYYSYEYFRDIMDHFTYTKTNFVTGVLSMNLDSWNKLNSEQKEVILTSAEQISKERFESAHSYDNEIKEKWLALGKKYIVPSNEQYKNMAQAVRTKVWPLVGKELGSDTLSIIENNVTKF